MLLAALAAHNSQAQIVDPQNVLIKNVYIVSAESKEDDAPVNVLIRDNKLEIVTRDEVKLEDGTTIVDGESGFLLGKLKIGETPSFFILDEDPTKNFGVLIDSGPHVVFAVDAGKLVKNSLFEVQKSEQQLAQDATTSGWMAYMPPPLALPTSYLDDTKWNKWETKYVNGIFLAAVLLDRIDWLSQDSDSEQQVGNLSRAEGGEIRGLRFGAVGTINFEKPWVYTVYGATNTFSRGFELEGQDSYSMLDYRLDIPVFDKTFLSIGKQKEPISMERIMSLIQLPMQERSSVSDAFLPSRNFGVVVSGNTLGESMSWAGGIFNNFIDSNKSIGSTTTQLVSRVTWLPYISQDESNLLHLGVGLRYSNAKQGVQYRTESEFNKSPTFVDTGLLNTDGSRQINLEATWRKGPYWLAAEYVSSRVDSPSLGDRRFDGFHITGSWIVSGEMRVYNRNSGILGSVPVSKSVYHNGWGAWEVSMRYSTLDLTDGLVDGGDMDIWSLGLNWWLSPFFSLSANYRHIINDQGGLRGESDGALLRILLVLE